MIVTTSTKCLDNAVILAFAMTDSEVNFFIVLNKYFKLSESSECYKKFLSEFE